MRGRGSTRCRLRGQARARGVCRLSAQGLSPGRHRLTAPLPRRSLKPVVPPLHRRPLPTRPVGLAQQPRRLESRSSRRGARPAEEQSATAQRSCPRAMRRRDCERLTPRLLLLLRRPHLLLRSIPAEAYLPRQQHRQHQQRWSPLHLTPARIRLLPLQRPPPAQRASACLLRLSSTCPRTHCRRQLFRRVLPRVRWGRPSSPRRRPSVSRGQAARLDLISPLATHPRLSLALTLEWSAPTPASQERSRRLILAAAGLSVDR